MNKGKKSNGNTGEIRENYIALIAVHVCERQSRFQTVAKRKNYSNKGDTKFNEHICEACQKFRVHIMAHVSTRKAHFHTFATKISP